MGVMRSVDPATGKRIEEYETLSDAELDQRLGRAGDAFEGYRRTSIDQRARWLTRAAEILEAESRQWAELMTREMGKPVRAAAAEAEKCAWACRYYADNGPAFLADEPVDAAADRSWIAHQPLGPVLAVMPWNFPFWQLFRFAAPALMAGNVALLKHASNVPGCALAIEEIFRRAGFPPGAFQSLLVESDRVGSIIEDARIRAVTLTGSEAAGASVAATAGREIKKTVLELGGSDPFIVMPSADLDAAVETAVQARHINNGQSCIAAKRFIVHEAVAEAFIGRFVDRTKALVLGDPMDERTELGPLATEAIRDELAGQVERSVDAGARLLTGGNAPVRPGWFYEATVLRDVPEGAAAAREETFGPLAAIFVVPDLDRAIEKANDTRFGLGASAWTRNARERDAFAERLDAGGVFINRMVASDPRLPFGGIKRSGYGRELARHGMLEFVNIKTVAADD
ncbi:MAG TPA: NAD-dependent succinate-semialdehyde dehydrogenase [Longimicrobiales bacterium]|nr:NAD-dependent succinate-semialdehyde dehydrogenase [Longimicrobiales bacterium]